MSVVFTSGVTNMFAKSVFAGAIVLVSSLSAATAATETYDFLGYMPGTYYSSVDFTSDMGNTVTVTAGTYSENISDGTEGAAVVGQWTGYGLGACSYGGQKGCSESHYVDGWGTNEFLKFAFGYDVTIESIQFKDYGDNYFDLTLANGANILDLMYDAAGLFQTTTDAMGSMFALGAYNWTSGFKVQSITVSYNTSEVPLPAAGWLLIAGLGGLAAMKRRSSAAMA